MPSASPGTATLHRMVMTKHMCPYGLKSLDLLKRQGFRVEDHHLTTRGEVDAFKEQHDVQTTPQTFIGGQRIGGYDDLRRHFGKTVRDKTATTYRPVIALFAMAAAMALATSWAAFWATTVEGRDVTEVAAELGISRGAIYMSRGRIMARIRTKVADVLEEGDA